MATITTDAVVGHVLAALGEAFDGPPPDFGYCLDRGDDAGLNRLLPTLSAEEASRSVAGSSIAAHVYHLEFSLQGAADYINGSDSSRDWSESWALKTVDDAAWQALQARLRKSHEALRAAIEANALSNDLAIGLTVGAPVHTAYHIGAIRQKLALIRQT